MQIKLRPKAASAPASPKQVKSELNASVIVKVWDIPIEDIELSEDNPNEESDKTFDALVETIKADGFHTPVQVVPLGNGKYRMVAGEHRYKAAKLLKFAHLPAVIHNDWDDTKRKIKLVQDNQLRGNMNPEKFTRLFNDLAKAGVDKELLKAQMGFTQKDAFEKVYKSVEKTLNPRQKKQLAEAKETIKSVDDLSSVLNTIFKDNGSELNHGFMVFSFGGQTHHYIAIDKELDGMISALEKSAQDNGGDLKEMLKTVFKKGAGYVTIPVKAAEKPAIKIRPRPVKK